MAKAESTVDVLIVGAGAAGTMAAACAAAYGMNARIIDKRPTKLLAGHGDGLHSRMMEILDTFGLADKVTELGHTFTVNNMWSRDADGKLERKSANTRLWEPPSQFTTTGLTQAKIADLLMEFADNRSGLKVERGCLIDGISVEEGSKFPVKVSTRKISFVNGTGSDAANNDIRIDNDDEILAQAERQSSPNETIRAKYVVACDGAHSWIRRKLEIPMVGDDMDVVWGVMDVWPITNFPSIRCPTSIQGQGRGLMIIPREQGMVRVYTVLGAAENDEDGKFIRSNFTPEKILTAAQEMLSPYHFSYKHCQWWAAYQIGQRVATDNIDPSGRIFLAGDAVHTHSPQAGQGQNVSMADTYNLMWKMNLVLKGFANSDLLQTYRDERHILAKQLVYFDRQWAAIISGRDPPEPPPGVSTFKVTWERAINLAYLPLIHGLQVMYEPSAITRSDPAAIKDASAMMEEGKMPHGLQTGMRMPSYQVRRHADRAIIHLNRMFLSDGRFRFVVFAGDISKPAKMERLNILAKDIEVLMQKYQSGDPPHHRLFDFVTIHASVPLTVELFDMPEICRPLDPELGYNYDKTFFDDDIVDRLGLHIGSAYKKYDIDPEIGRWVLLRPDGYIAYQGGLDDFEPVRRYFEGFLLPGVTKNGHSGSTLVIERS